MKWFRRIHPWGVAASAWLAWAPTLVGEPALGQAPYSNSGYAAAPYSQTLPSTSPGYAYPAAMQPRGTATYASDGRYSIPSQSTGAFGQASVPRFAPQTYAPQTYAPPSYPQPSYPQPSYPQPSYSPANYRQPELTPTPSNPTPNAAPGFSPPANGGSPGVPSSVLQPSVPHPSMPEFRSSPTRTDSGFAPAAEPVYGSPAYGSPTPNMAPPQYVPAEPTPSPAPSPSYAGSVPPHAASSGPYGAAPMPALACGPRSSVGTVDYFTDGPAPCGWFFAPDLMLWSFKAPRVTTIGDEASERFVTINGVTTYRENSLDTSWINSDIRTGQRYEFGRMDSCRGWMVGIMHADYSQSHQASDVSYMPADPFNLLDGYQDGNGDNIDDDVNNNHIYGRFGQDLGRPDPNDATQFIAPHDGIIDTPAPHDTGDLVSWLATFTTVRTTQSLRLTGFELMDVHRSSASDWNQTVDWFWGVRYLQVRDAFGMVGTGGILADTNYQTVCANDLIGPQIGARWMKHSSYVGFSLEGRFMAAYNHQDNRLYGTTASAATPGGFNAPVALSPLGFDTSSSRNEFAPVGELRANLSYSINRWAAFRVGYTALAAGGISRASEKVVYALPTPTLSNVANREVLFGSAITLGLEFNR